MTFRNACEMAQQLDQAVASLRRCGIRISDDGRFSQYQATLSRACTARKAGAANQAIAPPPDTHELFTALCEASDIWHISRLPIEQLERNLNFVQRIVTGNPSYTQAGNQDQGRDSQFQLMTASLFSRSGATVELESPADVNAVIGCWSIAVECKRPSSINALRRRIEVAYRQFREHELQGLNAVKIIAIELTTLVNPEFNVLVANSESEAADHIDERLLELFNRASNELGKV